MVAQSKPPLWRDYYSLTKPGVSRLLALTTLCTMFVAAKGMPDLGLIAATLAGLLLATSAAQVWNMVYDRDIDALMERTQNRALPKGRISPRHATIFAAALALASATVLLTLIPNPRNGGINWACFLTTFAGLLFYAVGYTMVLKRNSIHNVLLGGIAGALPPLVGWTAVTGQLDPAGWALFGIIFLWQCPHTWALAIWRDLDYTRVGVPMLPVIRGRAETKRQNLFYVCLLAITGVLFAFFNGMGPLYLILVTAAGLRYIQLSIQALTEADEEAWGKKMFFFSIKYLGVVFLALPLDVLIPQPFGYDIGMRADSIALLSEAAQLPPELIGR
ncbi:MAG: heme o synthase [Myxococcota bacterium]|nr:heme o synthase [Myxococcota bacterium]